MHFGVMKLDFNCLRCSSKNHEIKNIYLPEKKDGILKMDVGLYYLKICLDCGYTEMYSAKVVDKNEKIIFEY